MKRKFLVLGGDYRNVQLAQMLAEDQNKVITYGLEKSEEINENNQIDKFEKLTKERQRLNQELFEIFGTSKK